MRLERNVVPFAIFFVACTRTPASPPASAQAAPSPTAPSPATAAAPTSTPSVLSTPSAAPPATPEAAHLVATPLPLPGANGPSSLDFIFYEPKRARVWVPAGSTGSVDVLDVDKGTFTRIEGFKTVEREAHGKKRVVGPSSGSIGDGFAYVGNRATSEVCAIDLATLKLRKCAGLTSAPDGVQYVAVSKELWVTLPKEQTIAVLDASKAGSLTPKATIKLDGSPECYAIDEHRGRFFTNLEDKDRTLAIDVKTRAVGGPWNPGCGPDGPRGVAFDASHDFVIVACTDHVQVLDAGHEGAALGKLDAGAGVDAIDYVDGSHLLYVAAGRAARLTVARLDDKGQFEVVATGETSEGARNAVADAKGNAYVADSQQGRLLVLEPAGPRQ